MKRPIYKLRLGLKKRCRNWCLKEVWKYESASSIVAKKVR